MSAHGVGEEDPVVGFVMASIYSALAGSQTLEEYLRRAEEIRDRCEALAQIRRDDIAYIEKVGPAMARIGRVRQGKQ